jgi:hypothetical protein
MEEISVRYRAVRYRRVLGLLAASLLVMDVGMGSAQSQRSELELLKREMEELRRRVVYGNRAAHSSRLETR